MLDFFESKFFTGGLAIGFLGALPLGPIGITCLNRLVTGGRRIGVASGFGTAAADAVFGCLAGFGLKLVAGIIGAHMLIFKLMGAVAVCFMGIRTFFQKSLKTSETGHSRRMIHAFASTFFLTLANPTVILTFAAVLASLGIVHAQAQYHSVSELAAGVLFGAFVWWAALAAILPYIKAGFKDRRLTQINQVCGVAIVLFSLLAILIPQN